MKTMKMVALLVLAIGFPSASQGAVWSNTDDTLLIRKSDLPEGLVKELETKQQLAVMKDKIETYGKWVGMGKEVGVAINESLSALTVQADSFSKTGVGKFTMFMVAWKVIGKDFIRFLVGVPLLITWTVLFVWLFRKNCITYSVPSKQNPDKSKEYKVVVPLGDNDDVWIARLVHGVVFFLGGVIIYAASF